MDFLQTIYDHWSRLRPLCNQLELTLRTPIDKNQASRLGEALNLQTPIELQHFLTTAAGHLDLEYTFKTGDKKLNPIAKQVGRGGAPVGIVTARELIKKWDLWADTWDKGVKGPNAEYLSFEELFPLAETSAGNILALIDHGQPASPVIFLDHSGGPHDGLILADSLTDFMTTWCHLACPDPDHLHLFHDGHAISPETDFAKTWRQTLGL
jgi:hypothetical protein